MNEKCYSLNNLQKYKKKCFIYERKSLNNEIIYCYEKILQETIKLVECLQNYNVKSYNGIAIDSKEHSAANCILLLGILNHECHFYCLDLEEIKDVNRNLKLSRVKYIISSRNVLSNNIATDAKKEIKILDNVFYLYILKSQGFICDNVRLCFTIATSGSTGAPKMVHVPYKCVEPNIKALSNLLNIQENDVIFLGSPLTFDPFVVEFFAALENGASILITSKEIRLQSQELLKIMFPQDSPWKPGVTIYQTTPSLFRLFGKQSIQNVIFSNKTTLRCLILGGEEFPSIFELTTWLPFDFPATNKRIFNIYGITEVSCWSTIHEFDLQRDNIDKVQIHLGKLLDKLTLLRLVDKSGNVLHNTDCKGELEIGSSTRKCFIPQYDNDVKILESIEVIYRKTGDLVERDKNGNIFYIGRINNTIKRLGKRLCLDSLNKKVENILNANLMKFKCVSLWHLDSLNLIFYIVTDKKDLDAEKQYILTNLKQNLENHENPDKIIYCTTLPLNRHGKIDYKKILQEISTKLKQNNTPMKIFKEFLKNVMGFQIEDTETKEGTVSTCKRLKLSTNISFTKAGGTSFQALGLATEMSELMAESIERRKILEMLLDDNKTIENVIQFLISCSSKPEIEKLSYKCLEEHNSSHSFKLLWRSDLKKCIDTAPSVYEEKFVAVGSHSHLLLTLNTTTGEEISRLKLNDRIECPVVFVTSHLALVGCYDGYLYGFNFNNGSILWKLNANGMIKAKPLVIKNKIIIASYSADCNIFAFDLKSLIPVWSFKFGSKGIFSSPVQITEESVLLCNLDGSFALVDVDNGSTKWLQKCDSPIFSTPTKIQTSNKTLLVLAEVKGRISICQAESGKMITHFQAEGNVFSGLTLHQRNETDNTLIIFGCHDQNIYCLNFEYKNSLLSLFWKLLLNSAVYSTPIVISNSYIWACSTKGLMVLIDLQKPIVLASYDLQAEVFSSPSCLRNKYIYVGSRDNYLYAFELER